MLYNLILLLSLSGDKIVFTRISEHFRQFLAVFHVKQMSKIQYIHQYNEMNSRNNQINAVVKVFYR